MEVPEKVIEISFIRFLIESVMNRLPYMREVALLTRMKHTDDKYYENGDRSALIRDLIAFLSDDESDPDGLHFEPIQHSDLINIFRSVAQHLDICDPEVSLQQMSRYIAGSVGFKVAASSHANTLTLTFVSDHMSDPVNIEMTCRIISNYLQTLLEFMFGDRIIESIDILPRLSRIQLKTAPNVSHISKWKKEVSRITLNRNCLRLEKISYADPPAYITH